MGLADWLWHRYRASYLALAIAVAVGMAVVGIGLPTSVAAAVILEASAEDTLWVCIVALGLQCVVGIVAYWTMRRYLHPIDDWARTRSGDPVRVWETAIATPRRLARRVAYLVIPTQHLVSVPILAFILDISVEEFLVIDLTLVVPEVTSILLVSVGSRFLFRPLVLETTPLIPAGATPTERDWSLQGRLFVGIWAAATATGGIAAMVTRPLDDRVAVMGSGIAVGLIVGGYAAWLIRAGMLKPTLGPLADLTEAVHRIRLGDFGHRLPLTSADEFGELVTAVNEMQTGLAEREALHAAFGSYVDPVLARRLIETGSSVFAGEELVVTVLFADVRDFTSYSEAVAPSTAVDLLNRLFDVMVPVLHERGGHANHYLGDGLLAIFGAPNSLDQHADAAVGAAVEMHRQVRAEFGSDLRVGIGINTGPVIAGTVGGGGRHEFTVIGDTVNTAARVEQLTKDTGDSILITEATRTALSAPRPRATKRGAFDLKGKSAKVTVHAVNPFPRSTR